MEKIDYTKYIKARVIIGSRAYNLHTPTSDMDVRGFYVAPASDFLFHLYGQPPEQLELKSNYEDGLVEDNEVYWEVGKYLRLLCAANPTLLETLYTPIVSETSPEYDELRAERRRFLSKRAYKTYGGYAHQQKIKMLAQKKASGTPDWKNAMHMLRLMAIGTRLALTSHIDLDMGGNLRIKLLDIREGKVPFERVMDMYTDYEERNEAAWATTTLPEEPDIEWIEDYYRRVRTRSLLESIHFE